MISDTATMITENIQFLEMNVKEKRDHIHYLQQNIACMQADIERMEAVIEERRRCLMLLAEHTVTAQSLPVAPSVL